MDPTVFEVSTSHEEGGERDYLASTVAFEGTDGHVTALRVATTDYLPDGRRVPTPGTERLIPADLVLIAMGFTGAETDTLTAQAGADVTPRGVVARSDDYATNLPGVFVAGDAGRGQSLIVWAIAEGRSCAAGVDRWLSGTGATTLPAPIPPTARPLAV